MRDFIIKQRPAKIVSLHWALAEIDADGVHSTALAEAMWMALDAIDRRPYRLRVSNPDDLQISPTSCPGSLGQWCGAGLDYGGGAAPAMITLELPYDPQVESRPHQLPEDHLHHVRTRWENDADFYLRSVEGAVFKMLVTACNF